MSQVFFCVLVFLSAKDINPDSDTVLAFVECTEQSVNQM